MGERISRIQVEALHDQFDVDLNFSPGLNIIYGKNGRGKTTVLHILANALELDFSRFDHLSFSSIYIESFSGDQLQIKKLDGKTVVTFNGDPALDKGLTIGEISAGIRNAFGDTPTYLPAFRSVLERMRDPVYRGDADASLESLYKTELDTLTATLKSTESTRATMHMRSQYAIREEAQMTARKTLQCRQWFGSFVPIIRYPSIAEVSEGLTTEWRNAQLGIAQKEQSMFAEVFVRVFRAIVGMEAGPRVNHLLSTAEMLSAISGTLTSDDEKQSDHDDYQLGNYKGDAIYLQLKEAMEYMDQHPQSETREIERSVLNLYLETLTHRKQERKNALQKSRDFETSINKFLDSKKLRIGDFGDSRRGPGSAISVKSTGGHAYTAAALSSGEKQVLTMLYSASRSHFKSGAFLIDEPELSLHVDWQRIILRELIAQSPERQIIVCTHSPEVGADHLLETQEFNPMPTRTGQSNLFPPIDEEGE